MIVLSTCCMKEVYLTEGETTICSNCGDECGIIRGDTNNGDV